MKQRLKLTRNQSASLILLLLTGVLIWWGGRSQLPLALGFLILCVGQLVLIRSAETNAALTRRKIEKVASTGKRLHSELQNIQTELKGFKESLLSPPVRWTSEAERCEKPIDSDPSRLSRDAEEIARRLDQFIFDLDYMVDKEGIGPSRVLSVAKIAHWCRAGNIFVSPNLMGDFKGWGDVFEGEIVPLHRAANPAVQPGLIVILEEDVEEFNRGAYTDQAVRRSSVAVIGKRGSVPTETVDISGYRRMLPIDTAYGVQFFYPVGLILDADELHRNG